MWNALIASLNNRRHTHLLLLMYKLIKKKKESMLKKPVRQSRLHMAPAFWHYKPNNEKARKNVIYRVLLSGTHCWQILETGC